MYSRDLGSPWSQQSVPPLEAALDRQPVPGHCQEPWSLSTLSCGPQQTSLEPHRHDLFTLGVSLGRRGRKRAKEPLVCSCPRRLNETARAFTELQGPEPTSPSSHKEGRNPVLLVACGLHRAFTAPVPGSYGIVCEFPLPH